MEDILHRKNVNFSCIDETDKDPKLLEKWKLQRDERGFDDTETWNLDVTLAKFIVPRLKVFKELNNGYPSKFKAKEEWDKVLDEMIEGFELYSDKWKCSSDQNMLNLEEHKRKQAVKLLGEYFYDLWW
jgi:hypothetical protein